MARRLVVGVGVARLVRVAARPVVARDLGTARLLRPGVIRPLVAILGLCILGAIRRLGVLGPLRAVRGLGSGGSRVGSGLIAALHFVVIGAGGLLDDRGDRRRSRGCQRGTSEAERRQHPGPQQNLLALLEHLSSFWSFDLARPSCGAWVN